MRRIAGIDRLAFLLVVLMERQPDIKSRYGTGIGEKYVAGFVTELSGRLPASKQIYRWSESALVAEVFDERPAEVVECDIRGRFDTMPRTSDLDVGGRVAVLRSPCRWYVVPPETRREDIPGCVDAFLAT